MSRVSSRSVSVCPQPNCKGASQIEDTTKHDTWYIKRSRACTKCGFTWSTAEIPLPMIKRIMKIETLLRQIQ